MLRFALSIVFASFLAASSFAQTYTDLVQLGQQMAAARAATLLNITLMDGAIDMTRHTYADALQQFREHEDEKEGYSAHAYRLIVNAAAYNAELVYNDGHEILFEQKEGIHNHYVSPGFDIYHTFDMLREWQSEYGSAIMWCDEAQSVIEECNSSTPSGDIETIYMAASAALEAITDVRDKINTRILSIQFAEAGILEEKENEFWDFATF